MKRLVSLKDKRKLLNRVYYEIKPIIPRNLQIAWRRLLVPWVAKRYQDVWPIDSRASIKPSGWKGWPGNKKFAFVLTHDVDTVKGEDRCLELMKCDRNAGFTSAFYFVPSRLRRGSEIIPELKNNGFEIGVHDLFHDGTLFRSREIFRERAAIINRFLARWKAVGFRAGAMHHNLDWIHDLNVLYDSSTFDVDPFEPQSDGATTIFPFQVKSLITGRCYVELPYTLPQDFTLFVIMQKNNIDIWKKKLDWVASNGGMALVITHPDYMNFGNSRLAVDEYPASLYRELLSYIKQEYGNQYWHALPSEVERYVIRKDSV
jgi:hypothetical protein